MSYGKKKKGKLVFRGGCKKRAKTTKTVCDSFAVFSVNNVLCFVVVFVFVFVFAFVFLFVFVFVFHCCVCVCVLCHKQQN